MNDQDVRYEDRANRVKTFGTENTAEFTPGGKATIHFGNIAALLEQLGQAKTGQTPNRIGKTTLLDTLGLDLVNLSRTARQIGLKENGFALPYLIPANTSEAAVLTHTDTVLKRLEDQDDDTAAVKTAKAALRARFTEYEIPADFVAHLRADRDAIADANQRNQGEVLGGVEDTALIDQLLKQINGEVAELDTIMHNKYLGQPAKLAAWISASHTERPPRHKKETPPTPPQ